MSIVECVSINPSIDVSSQCSNIQPTHKIRLKEQTVFPGGGSVNVARVIKSLGDDLTLTCVVGGTTGDILANGIHQLGISCECIESEVNTRIAFTVLDEESGLEYRFVPKGSPLPETIYDRVIDEIAVKSPDYLVLSGSLPTGAAPDVYARMATSHELNKTHVVADCSGPALAATLESKAVFLVKPSLSELEQLAGKSLSENAAIEFASSLVSSGAVKNVAVSMGNKGAFVVTERGVLRAPALNVQVRSAVGAGDSFLAAIVHRLTNKDTMTNALRWGIAAGAAAVTTPGTRLCEIGVLNKLISEVKITEH